jgi:peptidoglycan/LPS O-acetylase OafA/YrhL
MYSVLYLRNYVPVIGARCTGILAHTWSLSVEEHFYFTWPFLLRYLLRRKLDRRTIVAIVVLGIFASAGIRYALCRPTLEANFPRLYFRTEARADSLLCGCLAALLVSWRLLPASQRGRKLLRVTAQVAVVGVAYLFLYAQIGEWMMCLLKVAYTVYAGAVALVIVALVTGALDSSLLEHPLLVWIGRLSYSLYLWHIPVYRLCTPELFGVSRSTGIWIQVSIAFLLAALSHYLIERPAVRLKHHLCAPKRAELRPPEGTLAA